VLYADTWFDRTFDFVVPLHSIIRNWLNSARLSIGVWAVQPTKVDLSSRNIIVADIAMSQSQSTNPSQINTAGGIHVGGNVNTDGGDFIGRDRINNNYYNSPSAPQKAWSTRNLKDEYIRPKLDFAETQIYLDRLRSRRLLIICNPNGLDVQTLTYFTACRLIQEVDLKVHEWNGEPEAFDVANTFLREFVSNMDMRNCIFILPDFSPRLFTEQDFQQILRSLRQPELNQYLIITSDAPHDQWPLSLRQRGFVIPLLKSHYEREYLTTELYKYLAAAKNRLPQNFPQELFASQLDDENIDFAQVEQQERCSNLQEFLGLSLSEIAVRLDSPENLDLFVQILCHEKAELRQETVKRILAQVQDRNYQALIQDLYERLQDPQIQLFAVALFLFGDLWESQFYVFLQETIDNAWRHIFGNVKLVDYYHLRALHLLFRYEDVPKDTDVDASEVQVGNERKIAFRYPEQRQHLLKAIWDNQRRHLIEALPVIVKIIERSADRTISRQIGYETLAKRRHLRLQLGEVLSDIGLLWLQPVESKLLMLASYSESQFQNAGIHTVVANALSRWYVQGEPAKRQLLDLLQRWQNLKRQGSIDEWLNLSSVQMTVARTIHYILLNDASKSMVPLLYDLTWGLLHSNNIEVRRYFNQYIFRILVQNYWEQIVEKWSSLINSLLIVAQSSFREGLKAREYLIKLLTSVKATNPELVNLLLDSWRETWLAQMLALSADDVQKWISALITLNLYYADPNEKQTFYQQWILPWVVCTTPDQFPHIVEALVVIAADPRETQASSDVETLLFKWLTTEQMHRNAHQIGFLYFTQAKSAAIAREYNEYVFPELNSFKVQWLYTIIAQIAVPYEQIVKNILPVAGQAQAHDPEVVKDVINAWRGQSNERIQGLASALQRALWVYQWRHYGYGLMLMSLVSVGVLLALMLLS
jgi:hypothetical protein